MLKIFIFCFQSTRKDSEQRCLLSLYFCTIHVELSMLARFSASDFLKIVFSIRNFRAQNKLNGIQVKNKAKRAKRRNPCHRTSIETGFFLLQRSTPFPYDNSLVRERIMGKKAKHFSSDYKISAAAAATTRQSLFQWNRLFFSGSFALFLHMVHTLLLSRLFFLAFLLFFCSIRFSLCVCVRACVVRVISQIIHGKNLQTKNPNEFVSRVPI